MRNKMPFMTAGVASSTIAVTSGTGATPRPLGAVVNSVYLANVGSNPCYIAFGASTVTVAPPTGTAATTETVGGMCIPNGFYGVIGTNGQSHIVAVTISANTATLRITPGEGFL
jgi:hypothetical protein